jgi:predicted TIM-barrel fold metal-dependent hydrolase
MKIHTLLLALFCLFLSLQICTAQSSPDELLLRNYRPRSIYKVPVTKNRKVSTPIIDLHSHPYADTEKELEAWVATLRALKIEKTIILSKSTGAKFDSIYQVYSKYGTLFDVWCGFDYTGYGTPAWPESGIKELERCYKKGARGIGELGDKGYGEFYSHPTKIKGIHIDDPKLKPLLKKCGELKMPVSIHVAEPQWMYEKMDSTNDGLMNAYKWRIDSTASGILGHDALVKTLEHAVRDNPGTTFIACHFANCESDLSKVGRLLKKYPNLYADISARFGETTPIPRYMKKFYQEHASKLVYGTDMGMEEDMYKGTFRILESADEHFYLGSSYHWPCHGFDLDEKTLNRVYYQNALQIIKR